MADRTQADVVAGLVAGIELAVVHLARTLAARGGVQPEALAASFEATAAALGDDVRNADLMRLSLRAIAAGVRSGRDGDDGGMAEAVSRLLH